MKKSVISVFMILVSVFCLFLTGCDSKDKPATGTDATVSDATETEAKATASDGIGLDAENYDYKVDVTLSGKESHFISKEKEDNFIAYIKGFVKEDNIINTVIPKEEADYYKTYFYASFKDGDKDYTVLHKSDVFYIIENNVVHSVKDAFNASFYLFLKSNAPDNVLGTSTDATEAGK